MVGVYLRLTPFISHPAAIPPLRATLRLYDQSGGTALLSHQFISVIATAQLGLRLIQPTDAVQSTRVGLRVATQGAV